MRTPIRLRTAFAASTTIHIAGGVAVIAGVAYWAAQNPPPEPPVVEFAVVQETSRITDDFTPPAEIEPHSPEPQLAETEVDAEPECEKTIDEPFDFQPEEPKELPIVEEPLPAPTPPTETATLVKAHRKLGFCKPPRYPKRAVARGWEGLVVIEVQVSATGAVKGARITTSSGHDILDTAALKAVLGWIFEPARRAEVTEAATHVVRIRFEAGKVSA